MIKSLQGLRVFGMLFVFMFHLEMIAETKVYQTFFYDGYFAVTFFLILSGFVMYISNAQKDYSIKNIKPFFCRRFKKIYFIHIVTFIINVLFIRFFAILKKPFLYFVVAIPNLLLLQSFFPIDKIYFSFNGSSWYLSTLMFCYLISIPCLILFKKINTKSTIFILLLVYLFQFILVFIGKDNNLHHWLFYINPIFRSGDYLIGMAIARIFTEKKNNNLSLFRNYFTIIEFFTVFIFIVGYLFARNIDQVYRWGVYYIPFMCLLIFIFSFEKGQISKILSNKFLVYFSSFSFEFYMVHQSIIIIMGRIFENNSFLACTMSFIISLVFAIFLNNISKKYLQQFKMKTSILDSLNLTQ